MLHYTKHFYVTADERDDLSCVADVTLMSLILLPTGPSSDGGGGAEGGALMTDFFRFLAVLSHALGEDERFLFEERVDGFCLREGGETERFSFKIRLGSGSPSAGGTSFAAGRSPAARTSSIMSPSDVPAEEVGGEDHVDALADMLGP